MKMCNMFDTFYRNLIGGAPTERAIKQAVLQDGKFDVVNFVLVWFIFRVNTCI